VLESNGVRKNMWLETNLRYIEISMSELVNIKSELFRCEWPKKAYFADGSVQEF
jgi:hypothetical protein